MPLLSLHASQDLLIDQCLVVIHALVGTALHHFRFLLLAQKLGVLNAFAEGFPFLARFCLLLRSDFVLQVNCYFLVSLAVLFLLLTVPLGLFSQRL